MDTVGFFMKASVDKKKASQWKNTNEHDIESFEGIPYESVAHAGHSIGCVYDRPWPDR